MSDVTTAAAAEAAGGFEFTRMIDLSVGLIDGAAHEPSPPTIVKASHEGPGREWMINTFGVPPEQVQYGCASEVVTAVAHAGTHVDAPWHYYPTTDGKPAKTIEECPLEWFFSDGVVLDMRHKGPGERIEPEDLERALERIAYEIKPFDIVMIMSGRDVDLGSEKYFEQPGMTRDSTLWLLDRDVKVIGVDMYGFDLSFAEMAREFRETGDTSRIWEAHLVGREREYCQIEKLVNLHLIPRPHGFKVAAFPIKIEGGSGGWCRPVAFV